MLVNKPFTREIADLINWLVTQNTGEGQPRGLAGCPDDERDIIFCYGCDTFVSRKDWAADRLMPMVVNTADFAYGFVIHKKCKEKFNSRTNEAIRREGGDKLIVRQERAYHLLDSPPDEKPTR